MIISHRYKFIFIKTVKTAGTSLYRYLASHCAEDDIFSPVSSEDNARPGDSGQHYSGFYNPLPEWRLRIPGNMGPALRDFCLRQRFVDAHSPAWKVKARVPAWMWRDYFTFAVERNPWDKTLSHFHMVKHRASKEISLDDYMARGNFPLNLHRYCEPGTDRIMVDHVVRYEDLNQELAAICDRLGIPFGGQLEERAKSGFRTDRRPYSDVFTPDQQEVVAQAFASEIGLFGYTF